MHFACIRFERRAVVRWRLSGTCLHCKTGSRLLSGIMKGALFLALVGAAHATEETQEIPFDNIPLLGKTEDFEMDVTLAVTGFIKSIEVNMQVSAKDGAPWWNDFALGVIYDANACKLSYGGFTSTLRYPNYQGCASLAAPPPLPTSPPHPHCQLPRTPFRACIGLYKMPPG